MNKFHVGAEIAPLRKVIVHSPDAGISRVSPGRSHQLLFDDIVYLPNLRKEHNVFADLLELFVGKENVLFARNLLIEALASDPLRRKDIIKKIIDFEELPGSYVKELEILEDEHLADVLITGFDEEKDFIYFDPIPNFIFTRDVAVMVNDHVIITKAAKEARHRENFLTRYIFFSHPMFVDLRDNDRIINLNDIDKFPRSRRGEPISIEGGDLMILSNNYLLIGASERTTAHAISSLKDVLFAKGVVENVVQINIPNDRAYMHIDTVFTRIHHNHVVCFKPLIYDGLSSYLTVYRNDGTEKRYNTVKEFMREEINPKMEFIFCGEGISPYQEREQWTDGCNLLALKPGVAVAYDRNPKTQKALKAHGYDIIKAEDFTAACRKGGGNPETLTNTILTIPSSELSRARGGSHCLSCPISRDRT